MATADINALERAAEKQYGLPEGIMTAVRSTESTAAHLADPAKYHYEADASGRRVAPHTGKISTAFGPYGILESTAKQPGYGTAPLASKSLEDQVKFAADYLRGRIQAAGSVEGGLAGYGEGAKYAQKVTSKMATSTQPSQVDLLAAQAIDRNNTAANILENLVKQQTDVIDSARNSLVGVREDAALVEETQQLARANSITRVNDFATKIGANPDAANEALSKLVEQSNKLFERKQAVTERLVNAGTPRNMFSDPVRYFADYLLVPHNKLRLDAVNTQLKSTQDQIKWINDSTQNYAQTMKAMEQSVTTESAAANARLVKAKMDADIAKYDLEKLKINSDGLLQVRNLRNSPLDIELKRRDQKIQEEAVAEARGQRAMQAQIMQMNLADKTKSAEAQNSFLSAVNLGRELNGGLAQFKSYDELEMFMRANPTSNAAIAAQFNAGLAASQTGQSTLAESPYGALTYVSQTGAKLDPGRQVVMDAVMGAYTSASTDPTTAKALATKATASQATNTVVRKKFDEYHADITRSGDDNPYAAPPLASLLDDPELSKTYFAQTILKPLADSGETKLPFTTAIDLLMKDLKSGKIGYNQADSELGFWAEKIKDYNNALRRYNATAGVTDMTGVNVPVNVPDVGGMLFRATPAASPLVPIVQGIASSGLLPVATKKVKVDLADPVKRTEFLNKHMAATVQAPVATGKVE